MVKYALIIDNGIYNVQDFRPKVMNSKWKKVTEDTTQVKSWQKVISSYALVNGEPIETKNIVDDDLADFKIRKYTQLAEDANRYISELYPLYKQLSALAKFYSPAENQAILDGVKGYFDIMQTVKTDLFAATTHAVVNDIYFRKNTALEGEPDNWIFWGV